MSAAEHARNVTYLWRTTMSKGIEFQDRAEAILKFCVGMTAERRQQYEKTNNTVFEQTAHIYRAIFDNHMSTQDVLRIFYCMKLARYGLQLNRLSSERSERTIQDSLIDSNVYAALMEAERQLSNESQAEATDPE